MLKVNLLAHFFLTLALAFGLTYGARYAVLPGTAAKSGTKTASVALLAAAGVSAGAPVLVCLGLALGAVGDFFLTRPGERAFLAGMGAFAVGHLAYAAQFWGGMGQGVPLLPAALMVGLALSTELWLAPRTGALRWPVRGYVVVICAMALTALGLGGGVSWVKVGAGLFVLSDLMLALDLFVLPATFGSRALLQRLLWAAYWGGQALILLGSLPAAGS